MTHPTQEELVSFAYGELAATEQKLVETHLAQCPTCARQIDEWQTLKGQLSSWKIPTPSRRNPHRFEPVKWAAAAMVMLALGFAFGRVSNSSLDVEKLRQELRAELTQSLSAQINSNRTADREQFIAMLRDVEEQRLTDYAQLRKDLETVAVVADEKLTTTQRAITRLNLVAQNDQTLGK